MTDFEKLESEIKERLAEKLGDDVMDLHVAINLHDWGRKMKFTRIDARVYASKIIIIKPASKWDMILLAMPFSTQEK